MRSRSRWNGVRTRHSSSGRSRPRVPYDHRERPQPRLLVLLDRLPIRVCDRSGERGHLRPRLVARSAAECAVKMGEPEERSDSVRTLLMGLDNDRDGAAVGAPRGPRHVAAPRSKQRKAITAAISSQFGQAAERPPGLTDANTSSRGSFSPRRLLVGEAAVAQPGGRRRRTRRDGVAAVPSFAYRSATSHLSEDRPS